MQAALMQVCLSIRRLPLISPVKEVTVLLESGCHPEKTPQLRREKLNQCGDPYSSKHRISTQ